MDAKKRRALIKTIDKIHNNKAFSKRLGVSDKSHLKENEGRGTEYEAYSCGFRDEQNVATVQG